MKEIVVAIDPGREKCGLAAVAVDGHVVEKAIVDVDELAATVYRIAQSPSFSVVAYAIGDRTGTDDIIKKLTDVGIPVERIHTVDEHRSSEIGRRRYWEENRPRGWRRMIPVSMQVPPRPYDDYVAVELAYRYLSSVGRG